MTDMPKKKVTAKVKSTQASPKAPDNTKFTLKLDTKMSKKALMDELRELEPWGHRIDFSNGASTKDVGRRTPFSINPNQKAFTAFKHIPTENLKGKRILDIGCNAGYSSIYAASEYGMKPTGIDVTPRHIKVSNMLSKMAGIKGDYKLGNAETYSEPGEFDVIFHFGTLYHLPNPLLSLKTTYDNLKSGGWLAVETQIYEGQDTNECYFMHMHNNDPTNFWALSPHVMQAYMEFIGFKNYKEVLRVTPKSMETKGMHRTITIVQKQ